MSAPPGQPKRRRAYEPLPTEQARDPFDVWILVAIAVVILAVAAVVYAVAS